MNTKWGFYGRYIGIKFYHLNYSSMKILVTGSNGLLGQHLIKMLIETSMHHIIATGRGESRLPFPASDRYHYFSLDITDGVAVNDFISQHRPGVIIHAAAMTQPDECEQHEVAC